MMYTIISLDDIFFAQSSSPHIETRRTRCGYAEYIEVNGRMKLRRFVSTDPSSYLDPRNTP